MKKEFHPFFCHKKQCRKTAWETPEYLTPADWKLLGKLISALEENNKEKFDKILYARPKGYPYVKEGYEDNDYIFFNRMIGWPEGKRYYYNMSEGNLTYWNGMIRNDLPKLKESYEKYKKET